MYALGIDIGTTTISAVVVNTENGNVETARTVENGSFLDRGREWERIQDPDQILSKVKALLDELFETYQNPAVIGLTGQMHGIVYLDNEGKHVSPLYTWQDGSGDLECFDGRSMCRILKEDYGAAANTGYGLITYLYHCRTGGVPETAAKVCTIMDYLGMVLTGRRTPLTHSSNAASLGLYDSGKKCFCTDILEKEGGKASIVPEVTDTFELLGTWRGVPVSTALGDNQASFLGSVTDAADSVLVNMGTGGQISVLSDRSFTAEGIEARPFGDGNYLLAGSSLCGGQAYAALKNFFEAYAEAAGVNGVDHYEIMDRFLTAFDRANCAPMKVTTTFLGTRGDPKKRGSIEGISLNNFSPAALTYGVLEGMAEELYQMYKQIVDGLHISRSRMIASGNGIRMNRHLQKIMCEKFSMTLQMAPHEEEAAYGAARSGLIAAGYMTLAEAVGVTDL